MIDLRTLESTVETKFGVTRWVHSYTLSFFNLLAYQDGKKWQGTRSPKIHLCQLEGELCTIAFPKQHQYRWYERSSFRTSKAKIWHNPGLIPGRLFSKRGWEYHEKQRDSIPAVDKPRMTTMSRRVGVITLQVLESTDQKDKRTNKWCIWMVILILDNMIISWSLHFFQVSPLITSTLISQTI